MLHDGCNNATLWRKHRPQQGVIIYIIYNLVSTSSTLVGGAIYYPAKDRLLCMR